MKKTARELREEAKRLLQQADKIENERAIKIGKIVLKHVDNNFKDFNLEAFKKEVFS
ncbi:MAG: hypothetical protein HQL08_08690 [Nitrospirae bacterium]|nr:hypothetical protein [Nitrospirota bacterium]